MSMPIQTDAGAPFSQQAEEAVLGALILDSEALAIVRNILQPQDFFLLRHNYIYAAMLGVVADGQPMDQLTLAEKLESVGRLDLVGGHGYLIGLANNTPTSVYAEVYAEIVKRASVRRQIMADADAIKAKAMDESISLDELVQAVSDQRDGVVSRAGNARTKSMHDVMSSAYDEVFRRAQLYADDKSYMSGIATGFYDFDRLTDGFQRKTLSILAAASGVGKSSAAMTLALYAAQKGIQQNNTKSPARILFFSGEMDELQLAIRAQATMAGVDSRKINRGSMNAHEFSAWGDAVGTLSEMPIEFKDGSTLKMSDLRATVQRLKVTSGLDMVILDGILQLQGDKSQEKRFEIGGVMLDLKKIADDFNVAILATHQTSRKTADRQNKRPTMSDLAESADIERAADIVAFLYREDYYEPDTMNKGIAELILAKHRSGPTGTTKLIHAKKYASYVNFTDSYPDE